MAGYIGSDKSGVIVGGYTNSQIDTAISTHAYSKAQVDTLIEAAGAVTVSATEPSSPSEGEEGSVLLTVTSFGTSKFTPLLSLPIYPAIRSALIHSLLHLWKTQCPRLLRLYPWLLR